MIILIAFEIMLIDTKTVHLIFHFVQIIWEAIKCRHRLQYGLINFLCINKMKPVFSKRLSTIKLVQVIKQIHSVD